MAIKVHTGERTLALGAVAGIVAGVPFALWMMVYSAATASGFLTPFNVCWAFFVYRSEANTALSDAMMHPGMMMDEPVQFSPW
jgi:membrane protease YdiL (CAAX protease family)